MTHHASLETSAWFGRWVILWAVAAVPFVRFLLQNQYSLFRSEVLIVLLTIAVFCAVLSWLARGRVAFAVTTLVWVLLQTIGRARLDLFPEMRLRWLILGLAVGLVAAMVSMREYFYRALLVFVLATFAVDVVQAVSKSRETGAGRRGAEKPGHVLHLILDGHTGIAGFPRDIPECVAAREGITQALLSHRFTVYRNGYSNYVSTRDSIPSALDVHLIRQSGELIADWNRAKIKNPLFGKYASLGFAIHVYESDYLTFRPPPGVPSQVSRYAANDLSATETMPLSLGQRIRQITAVYSETDWFWCDVYTRISPSQPHPRFVRAGPLASRDLLPKRISHDIQSAGTKTLFFGHLLTPHYPYVYKADGSLRNAGPDWLSDYVPQTSSKSVYQDAYRRYCEQASHLGIQLRQLFADLEKAGLMDAMTVVIHGDHGSRNRLISEPLRKGAAELGVDTAAFEAPGRYDYGGKPELRDLLDRFSTLLAIKKPRSGAGAMVSERMSLLRFYRSELGMGKSEALPGEDSAYLIDEKGLPVGIRMLDLWPSTEELN